MHTHEPEFLLTVIRDLIEAEAAYRSAMKIYKDHPGHMTRIRAESRWHHALGIAKHVASNGPLERS